MRSEEQDNAIVQLARSLLIESIEARASDIHMQPFAGGGLIRIRVDGLLRRLLFLQGSVLEQVIRYFKAQGGMDSTNSLAPQDGRMSLILGGRDFDLRLSVLPASRGERLVIRFLDQSSVYRLGQSGLSTAAVQAIRRLGANSSGVVLVTGPTGSGKSSTLYSLLSEINRTDVSIITVENPVEYRVMGISQVDVNPKAGLTFSTALRSILRQDPDVILIGEIRDSETAEIAMEAALTGHLVLSTLHTNDALGAIPRLIDLGVHPSVVADAIAGVIAQRLFRRLCAACRIKVNKPLKLDEELFLQATGERPAYRAVGCSTCGGTGYRGRQPVVEIVEFTPEARQYLRSGDRALEKLAELTHGPLSSLSHGAAMRVISGDTTAAEAYRVIGQRFWNDLARDFNRPPPAMAATLLDTEESDTAKVTILLFASKEQDRVAFAGEFEKSGIRVLSTCNPDAVREQLQKDPNIALLVFELDAGSPERNIQLLLHLRASAAWTRLPAVLVLSANDPGMLEIVDKHGVLDYLVKPVTPAALVSRIAAVLAR